MNINSSQSYFRTASVTPYGNSRGIGATVQRNNTQLDAQVGLGSSGITGGAVSGQVDHRDGSIYGGAGFNSNGHFSGGTIGGSSNGNSAAASFNDKGNLVGGSVGTSKDGCTYSAGINKGPNGDVSGGLSVSCSFK